MPVPVDLADLTDPDVRHLVAAWLDVAAESITAPGAAVRRLSSSLAVLLPSRLLLTLHEIGGTWQVRVQSLELVAELGSAGRAFSIVGNADPHLQSGLGDPRRAADALSRLCQVDRLLQEVQPVGDGALLQYWRVRCSQGR